ncbi:MAG TPA: hypothetical protein VFV75_08065 [Candidatus Polarisedimenticolaceae bacterium]|nr:hypothetical protein [Candidatus Polarisedimenticolaceae bacterium]
MGRHRQIIASSIVLLAFAAAAEEVATGTVRPFVLPDPWGEHGVGVLSALVVDASRTIVTEDGRTIARPVPVQLWYPAVAATGGARTKPYMHPELAEAWRATLPAPAGWQDSVVTHAVEGAEPARGAARWKVILFSHGLSWPIENYQILFEDLASRGWVVAGLSHPGEEALTRLPDGTRIGFSGARWDDDDAKAAVMMEKVDQMVLDASAVLDRLEQWTREGRKSPLGRLAGRLDLASGVGYAGHSLGGATAAWTLRRDRRVKAAASWEGQIYRAEDRPMKVTGPLLYLVGGSNRAELAGRHFRGDGADRPVYEVVLRGAWHASPSDLLYVYQAYGPRDWRARHRREISPARANQITADYLDAFFSRYLNGAHPDLLRPDGVGEKDAERNFPEVEMRLNLGGEGFWTASETP